METARASHWSSHLPRSIIQCENTVENMMRYLGQDYGAQEEKKER